MSSELLLGSCALLGLKPCKDSDQPVEIYLVSTETGLLADPESQNLGAEAIADLYDGTNWTLIPDELEGKYTFDYLYTPRNRNGRPDPIKPTDRPPEEGAIGHSFEDQNLHEETIDRS